MPSTLGGERARDRGDAAVAELGGERDGGDHRAVAGIAPYLEFARRSGRGFVRDVLHIVADRQVERHLPALGRSEERRGGKEWVSTRRSRRLPYPSKQKTNQAQ